jgi:hypothetical protein
VSSTDCGFFGPHAKSWDPTVCEANRGLSRKFDRCGTTRARVVIFIRGADASVRGDLNDGLDSPSSVSRAPGSHGATNKP